MKRNLRFNKKKKKMICEEHETSIITISRKVVEIHAEQVDHTSQHCQTQIGNFIVHREGAISFIGAPIPFSFLI